MLMSTRAGLSWYQNDACLACPAGTYAKSSGCRRLGESVDAACAPCSTSCPAGFYQAGECSADTDLMCSPCSTCASGEYNVQACTATSDTLCATCQPCADGEYRMFCTGFSLGVCTACDTIADSCYGLDLNSYLSGCSGVSGGECLSCSAPCGADQYAVAECSPFTDNVCVDCDASVCPNNTQLVGCGPTTGNGTCVPCEDQSRDVCAALNAAVELDPLFYPPLSSSSALPLAPLANGTGGDANSTFGGVNGTAASASPSTSPSPTASVSPSAALFDPALGVSFFLDGCGGSAAGACRACTRAANCPTVRFVRVSFVAMFPTHVVCDFRARTHRRRARLCTTRCARLAPRVPAVCTV